LPLLSAEITLISWAWAMAGIGKLPATAAADMTPALFKKVRRVVDVKCLENAIEFLPVELINTSRRPSSKTETPGIQRADRFIPS
jgi:hypothetical protein